VSWCRGAPTIGPDPVTYRLSVDSNFSFFKLVEKIDAPEQSGFSRAARSKHDHDVALRDIEAQSLENFQ